VELNAVSLVILIQLWPTCPDALVVCVFDALLTYVHGTARLPNVNPAALTGDLVGVLSPRWSLSLCISSQCASVASYG
jgi:hypothetical protein